MIELHTREKIPPIISRAVFFSLILFFFHATTFGQSPLQANIRFSLAIDSAEYRALETFLKEEQNGWPIKHAKKTIPITALGTFIKIQLNHLPPESNSAQYYIPKNGLAQNLTKALLDSIYMQSIADSSFLIPPSQRIASYILFSSGGYELRDENQCGIFQKPLNEELWTLLQKQEMKGMNEKQRTEKTLYTYYRPKRTIYAYTFYFDDMNKWTKAPKKKVLYKEVGPINHWR